MLVFGSLRDLRFILMSSLRPMALAVGIINCISPIALAHDSTRELKPLSSLITAHSSAWSTPLSTDQQFSASASGILPPSSQTKCG